LAEGGAVFISGKGGNYINIPLQGARTEDREAGVAISTVWKWNVRRAT